VKTIEQIVAANIKKRRETLGWSQLELARNAKLSETTINRIEKARQPARRKNLEAVAKALGCTREDLGHQGHEPAPPSDVPTLPEIQQLLKLFGLLNPLQREGVLTSIERTLGVFEKEKQPRKKTV